MKYHTKFCEWIPMNLCYWSSCKLAMNMEPIITLKCIKNMYQDTLYYILRHTLCSGVQVWKGCKICWCALTNCWDSKKMMMFAYEWEPAGLLEKGTLRVASLSFNRIYNSNGILSDIWNGLANPENSAKLSITITEIHETTQS